MSSGRTTTASIATATDWGASKGATARLARDGAITPEEYEAKRAELLKQI
jgi:hypothetical protein